MSLLTRNGYLISDEDFEPWHADELTVTTEANKMFNKGAQSFPVFCNNDDGTVAVPRYWGEDNFGRPVRFFGHIEKASNLVFVGSLRSAIQREAAEKTIEHISNHGGGVLSLFTGFGKTTVSLYVACSLKLKTLVVVHKQFLLDQWEERIKTFIPTARVGRIQQDLEDVDDCDIVVSMLQSVAMRDYDNDIFSDFGLVIFDEVHVVPAPVFSRALFKLSAPHMLGLSATPVRRDGLSRVIHWFIGPIFFQHALSDKNEVTVKVVDFRIDRKLPMNMAAATTMVCNIEARNKLIVKEIHNLVVAGHKVILLSDRRAHCEKIKLMLETEGVDAALYLGGMKNHELKQSSDSIVLLCTFGIAKEGLDIPSLNALVLACPRSDVVQACGRILHGRSLLPPVIVDIVDQWVIGKAQFKKRLAYYKTSGFVVDVN